MSSRHISVVVSQPVKDQINGVFLIDYVEESMALAHANLIERALSWPK